MGISPSSDGTLTPVLELSQIRKRFGSAVALDGADFVLAGGEVHGLLGENGAGKSTLMHLAFGLSAPDAGRIKVRGRVVALGEPADAKRLRIGMVHQHFTSVPALTVQENLWLAAGRHGATVGTPAGSGSVDTAIGRLRRRLWEGLDPAVRAEELSVGAKQRLEMLQALASDAEILLLDEPTAVLAPPEVTELLGLLGEFARGGGSVVFITHKLDEVFAVASRVTVLRRGQVTFSGAIDGCTPAGLARAMVGDAAADQLVVLGAPVEAWNTGGGPVVRSASGLEARRGEIVGLAAVEGNGQRALLRALLGPSVAFVPEDRTTEGLIGGFSLTENLVLGLPTDPRWVKGPWVDWPAASRRMGELLGEFGIRASGPDAPARSLSGGNQQKVVLARAFEAKPQLIVAENPTRGLDIHATAFVHDQLRAYARDGGSVVFYSTDLDEVLGLATRVVVMVRGAVLPVATGASRRSVGAMMLGVGE